MDIDTWHSSEAEAALTNGADSSSCRFTHKVRRDGTADLHTRYAVHTRYVMVLHIYTQGAPCREGKEGCCPSDVRWARRL